MSIQTINPTTGEVLETFEPYSQQQIDEALDQARQAFLQWRALSYPAGPLRDAFCARQRRWHG